MRYGVGSLAFFLVALAGLALNGAGHGWVAGSFGCFALAPVAFLAAANALRHKPSHRGAVAILIAGLAVCSAVAVATQIEGNEHLVQFMRVNGPLGLVVAGVVYLGWLVVASLGVFRARQVLRHGT